MSVEKIENVLNQEKLLHLINNGYNVLIEGHAGVGKTASILEAFKKANLRYLYFSASTMDPFIDFCGVPVKIDSGDSSYIELIIPKYIKETNPQALFFDELNRANKKIRNAVMELIQFKTINGRSVMKDLKIVWAAINPEEDGEYDVEKLDPAQKDRFPIHLKVPYKCNSEYFKSKYGREMSIPAIQWWEELEEADRKKISPRRLDYAIKASLDGVDISDILPSSCNISKLKSVLKVGPAIDKIISLKKEGDKAAISKFLKNDNNYNYLLEEILKETEYKEYFIPLFPSEKISILYIENPEVKNYVDLSIKRDKNKSPFFTSIIDIMNANKGTEISKNIKDLLIGIGFENVVCKMQFFKPNIEKTDFEKINELCKKELKGRNQFSECFKNITESVGEDLACSEGSVDMIDSILDQLEKISYLRLDAISEDIPSYPDFINYIILSYFKAAQELQSVENKFSSKIKINNRRTSLNCPSIYNIHNYFSNSYHNEQHNI